MAKRRRAKKPLAASDFAGEGEPYTEVTVTISIRILGAGITRSRLAVNVCPDPALEPLARKSLHALKKEHYGINEDGFFGACLSENFNGWDGRSGPECFSTGGQGPNHVNRVSGPHGRRYSS